MQESSVRQRYHPFTNVSQWRDTHWGVGWLSEHHAMGMIISDTDWLFAVCQAAQTPQSLTPAPDVDFPFTVREFSSQRASTPICSPVHPFLRIWGPAQQPPLSACIPAKGVRKSPSLRHSDRVKLGKPFALRPFCRKAFSPFPQAPFRFSSEYMLLSEMICALVYCFVRLPWAQGLSYPMPCTPLMPRTVCGPELGSVPMCWMKIRKKGGKGGGCHLPAVRILTPPEPGACLPRLEHSCTEVRLQDCVKLIQRPPPPRLPPRPSANLFSLLSQTHWLAFSFFHFQSCGILFFLLNP